MSERAKKLADAASRAKAKAEKTVQVEVDEPSAVTRSDESNRSPSKHTTQPGYRGLRHGTKTQRSTKAKFDPKLFKDGLIQPKILKSGHNTDKNITIKEVTRPTAPPNVPNGDEPPPTGENDEELRKPFTAAVRDGSLGQRLKQARIEAGLTQQQVAELMGTRDSAIRRIENDRANLTIGTVQDYADAVGYDLSLGFTPKI